MAIVYQNGIAGKICANPECGWKPLSEFANARSRGIPVGDGFKSRCRDCWNAQIAILNVQPSLKNTGQESASMLKPTKIIIENLNVLIKRQILKSTKRHSANIVKLIVKRSIPEPKNADSKS